MVTDPVWQYLGELSIVLVSVMAASVTTYRFALRAARKERHHDIKLQAYSRYLEALGQVSEAVQALQLVQLYSPRKDQKPQDTFMQLSGLVGTTFTDDRLRKWKEDMEAFTEDLASRTEEGAWRSINQEICSLLEQEAGIKLVRNLRELQRAAIGLRLIKSKSIVDPANQEALAAVAQVARNVTAMAHPKAPPRRAKVVQKAVEGLSALQGKLAILEANIQSEIQDAL